MSALETTQGRAAQRAYTGFDEGDNGSGDSSNRAIELEKMVREYSPLVYRIARRVRRRVGYAVELDDLICEGTIGLLQAAERFDPSLEKDFEHLAQARIQGAMLDSLRRLDPLSQRRRREARRVRNTREKLESRLGRVAGTDEMANELGMELEDFHSLHRDIHIRLPVSTEDLNSELQSREPDPRVRAEKRERIALIRELIETLPERQRLVLSLIYFNELSQKDVANVLQVTEARVSQLHKEALERVRKRMKSQARPHEEAW